jgi:predicted secreted protein
MVETAPDPAGVTPILLAAAPRAGDLLTVFLWFAIAAAVAVAGFYAAAAVRRWSERDQPVASFTIQDLRDMRSRGEISEQEFVAMRGALLAELRLEGDSSSTPPGPPPPDQGPAGDVDVPPDPGSRPPEA